MVKFKTFCAISVCLILAYVLFSGIIRLGDHMAREAKKEQCIVFKHQRDAEKFLALDCNRYVSYQMYE